MKRLILALAVLAFVIPMITPTAQAQNNHNPIYLWNGYQTTSTSTTYWRGFYIYDRTSATPALTKLFDPPYYTQFGSACMDWDNQSFIFATGGTGSVGTQYDGACKIFRYNPATSLMTTVCKLYRRPGAYAVGYAYQYCYDNIHIDQDGNYLFSFYQYDRKTSPTTTTTYTRGVLKYTTATQVLSTVLTSANVNPPYSTTFGYLTRDIDSGKVLVATYRYMTNPTTMKYPVISIDPLDGYSTVGFWNDGSGYGWGNYSYNCEQNVRNGYIQGPYYYVSASARINQVMPGTASWTTISTIPSSTMPFGQTTQYLYTGKFDLQTAPKPSWKSTCYYYSKGSAFLDLDATTWTVNSHAMVASSLTMPGITRYYPGQFEYWGGRHIQTKILAANKWAMLFNVPHHPGKGYYCAAGYTGVRPGMALGDGRNINLNFDTLVYMTVNNLIPTIWNPGPAKLDANGMARGSINVAALSPPKGGFGMAIWIAVIVMDPKAPGGIAYVPDTYVIRI